MNTTAAAVNKFTAKNQQTADRERSNRGQRASPH
jgi:hypothetical protein